MNGREVRTIFNPQTGMITEITSGPGYQSIRTFNRNNPNSQSISTTSNNNFSQSNSNLMFPPGFPFHNVHRSNRGFNFGTGFPFGNQINFNQSGSSTRRRTQSNRNDLNQIFGVNDGEFENWYGFIVFFYYFYQVIRN